MLLLRADKIELKGSKESLTHNITWRCVKDKTDGRRHSIHNDKDKPASDTSYTDRKQAINILVTLNLIRTTATKNIHFSNTEHILD